MNILVTGGAGFIGSHVCVKLLELGYKIIVIDNLSNSLISTLYNISKIVNIDLNIDEDIDAYFTFIKADIRDKEPLEKIFSVHEIDAVIHFAGLSRLDDSFFFSSSKGKDQYAIGKNIVYYFGFAHFLFDFFTRNAQPIDF